MKEWLLKLLLDEYEVTIWVDPKNKSTYSFKKLPEVSANHVKGQLISGEFFEIRTQEPFNYLIRQVR